ncbi:MAG: PEGA domain-containing protein [Candidatus Daviesbacteria bacterium]|nr:PEGA domain-containing protein [Candidatus Daviesbacteria bacterium]
MKKILFFVLILLSLLILVIRFTPALTEIFLGIKPRSGISIMSNPTEAVVFLDNQEVGKTPYENKELLAKEYLIRIEKDKSLWQGKIKLTAGTLTVINRELSDDPTSQAGEILTLEKGRGMTIISNPSGADIEVDGKSYGQTPISINLESGERTILISRSSYLKRSIKATLPQGFSLTISADLALSEADLTNIPTPIISQTEQVTITNTPTDFLRVRERPTTTSKEIARANPGDTLILLEELSGWDRVRLPDGTEGYVSSAYTQKK